jgi:hypothetical protein
MIARESVEITTADTYLLNSNKRLARACLGYRHLTFRKSAGLFQHNLFHQGFASHDWSSHCVSNYISAFFAKSRISARFPSKSIV